MDDARRWSDEQLKALERRIEAVYRDALEEMQAKEYERLQAYEAVKRQYDAQLANGQITQKRYDRWMREQAADLTRSQGMVDEMAHIANDANRLAASIVNNEMPTVFAENANWAAYYVDQTLGDFTGFDIVNRDAVTRLLKDDPDLVPRALIDSAKDLAWNRQKFGSAITQSILSGDSIEHAVERLANVMGMNERHATMLARTAMTSAENGGRMYTYQRARDNGVTVEEVWLATLDSRTRDSHRQLDGEKKDEKTGKFSNGLRYPGDPSGPPEEVANCRCRLNALVSGFKRDYSDVSRRFSMLPKSITYSAWKALADLRTGEGVVTNG